MNMFEGYGFGKSVRYHICQTGGLALWVGINLIEAHIKGWRHDSPERRALEMKALREFPYDPDEKCRCRDCRYIRMTRNWSNL